MIKTQLKTLVQSLVSGEITDTDWDAILNNAATEMTAETDLNSLKRYVDLEQAATPVDFEYVIPTDLKGRKIIDIVPEENRSRRRTWRLIPFEEFERTKSENNIEDGIVAIKSDKMSRILLVSGLQDEDHQILYYSKYPWRDNSDNWIATSTEDTDLINLEEDELTIFKYKAAEIAEKYLRNWENADRHLNTYIDKRRNYLLTSPSEALLLTSIYSYYE